MAIAEGYLLCEADGVLFRILANEARVCKCGASRKLTVQLGRTATLQRIAKPFASRMTEGKSGQFGFQSNRLAGQVEQDWFVDISTHFRFFSCAMLTTTSPFY